MNDLGTLNSSTQRVRDAHTELNDAQKKLVSAVGQFDQLAEEFTKVIENLQITRKKSDGS